MLDSMDSFPENEEDSRKLMKLEELAQHLVSNVDIMKQSNFQLTYLKAFSKVSEKLRKI